jgi:hypothetical protein
MATTTYAINAVTGQTLVNDTTAGDQYDPSVVTTADGGAAVFYVNGARVDGRLLDSDGNPIGRETLVSGNTALVGVPKAARLTNGDFAVVWEEEALPNPPNIDIEVLAPDLTPITAILHPVTVLMSSLSSPSVAALSDGSFVLSYTVFFGLGQTAVAVSRFSANGNETLTDSAVDINDVGHTFEYSSITGLSDGGYAIAYEDKNNSTLGTAMKRAVFNANDTVRAAPLVFDSFGSINRSPDASSLPNGGFVVGYEDNEYSSRSDTTTAFFDAAGTFLKHASATNASGSDSYTGPAVATSPDGYLFTTQTHVVNVAGSLIAPNGVILIGAENVDALADKAFGDVTWLDGSHVLLTETSLPGSMLATGVDSSGYAVDSVVFEIVRTTTGDSTTPLDFSADGIDNLVNLGSGNDTVLGGKGTNTITGNGGNDVLIGGAGGNSIYALGGNNYLQGGAGSPS